MLSATGCANRCAEYQWEWAWAVRGPVGVSYGLRADLLHTQTLHRRLAAACCTMADGAPVAVSHRRPVGAPPLSHFSREREVILLGVLVDLVCRLHVKHLAPLARRRAAAVVRARAEVAPAGVGVG